VYYALVLAFIALQFLEGWTIRTIWFLASGRRQKQDGKLLPDLSIREALVSGDRVALFGFGVGVLVINAGTLLS